MTHHYFDGHNMSFHYIGVILKIRFNLIISCEINELCCLLSDINLIQFSRIILMIDLFQEQNTSK